MDHFKQREYAQQRTDESTFDSALIGEGDEATKQKNTI